MKICPIKLAGKCEAKPINCCHSEKHEHNIHCDTDLSKSTIVYSYKNIVCPGKLPCINNRKGK